MTAAANKTPQPLEKPEMFEFGENWAEYSVHINDLHISKAQEAMAELLGNIDLKDKTFLDIGCGSGLHSLAALKAGAKSVHAVDIDKNSADTTRATLKKFWPENNYKVEQGSILDPALSLEGPYDVVYSWGVLHHTGDMWTAIKNAVAQVAPKGHFVIALYKETPFCGAWKIEKKLYISLPKILRYPLDWLYGAAQCAGLLIKGRNPLTYIKTYPEKRGMRWMTDIKDWLGGYPYESVSPAEITEFMEKAGFRLIQSLNDGPVAAKGILGSGCGEYVFERVEEK